MTLLHHDTLIVQQMTGFVSNNFDVYDPEGTVIAHIQTEGSLGSRLLKGNRTFTVSDGDGEAVLLVRDPMNFVRDTYELDDPDGTAFAHVRKRFTFLKKRMDIELASGGVIELHGNFLGFEFEFMMGDRVPARVTRKWSGAVRGLLGRSTYALIFDPEAPEEVRKAIIGGMIALDLIRAKENNN